MSWLFASGGQSIGASASESVLPEYSGLISFKIDWFDLLAVQGTLKSLLQHHSLKASILWCSAFLMVHLSHQYMTTGKTIALSIRTFCGEVRSLFFNTLSRSVIAFLPRCNHLISWVQSPSTVILEPKRRKSVAASTFYPSNFLGLKTQQQIQQALGDGEGQGSVVCCSPGVAKSHTGLSD